ncbi:hypothetical protein Ciccas_012852, partial [Cichlidogyrus casuarinus]
VEPDEAERRMKRRERNRRSAQKCRERKVQRTQELQAQVDSLKIETNALMRELESWRTHAKTCIELLRENCPNLPIPQSYFACLAEDEHLTTQINSASMEEGTGLTQTSSNVDEHSMSMEASEHGAGSPQEAIGYLPSMSSLSGGFRLDEASQASEATYAARRMSPMSSSTVSIMTASGLTQNQNLSASSSNSTGLCNIITERSPAQGVGSGANEAGGSSSSSSPTNYDLAFTGAAMDTKL